MPSISDSWIYELVGFIAALLFLQMAITGRYFSRRSVGGEPRGPLISVPFRLALLLISIAILAFIVWMSRGQIKAVFSNFEQG